MKMTNRKSVKSLALFLSVCIVFLCTLSFPVKAAGPGYTDLYQISVLSGVDMDSSANAVALLYGDEKGNPANNYAVVMKMHDKRGDLLLDVIPVSKFQEMVAGSLSSSQMSTSAYNAYMLENGVPDEYLLLEQKPPIVDQILQAAANGSGSIKIKNTLVIMPEALKLAAEKCGDSFTIQSDTMNGKKLDVRMVLTPSKTTKGVVAAAYVDESDVRDYYQEKYSRDLGVIEFYQEGSFGTTVKVTAKVDLKGLDTDNLLFYSLNRVTNKVRLVENTDYKFDSKGYLVFYTDTGNTMLITDKKLK